MSPVLDAVLTATLARELASRLRGGRLRALRLDRSRHALALLFRHGTLRVSPDPTAAAVAWSGPLEPGPADRRLPARFRAAGTLPDDRVLVLSFTRVRGSPAVVEVIVEWISNRWNAFITEGGERVVRHALMERGGRVAARAGRPWTPPTPSTRAGLDGTLALDRWRALLLSTAPELRRRTLLAQVAWTSPVNAPALLAQAAGRRDDDVQALDAGHRLWQELAATARGTAESRPVFWPTPNGVQPYPLPLPGEAAVPSPSLIEAFTRAAASATGPPTTVPGELLDAIGRHGVRAWARLNVLRRELAEAPDPTVLRATADLLLARLGELTRGAVHQRLVDFAGVPVDVDLDPTRSPQENASVYYQRAARAERARKRLPGLIEEAEHDARRLERLVEAARQGAMSEEALRGALPPSEAAGPALEPLALPYRVYRSSGGLEIRVGKGARHNDELTFHHSTPADVWMHARHAAGAHVVLRWQEEANPPARDLAEAAVLAALHSKARTSGRVPIDWTRRKYVRKPRRSPPGQVLVERAKTLFVTPDPELEERLRV